MGDHRYFQAIEEHFIRLRGAPLLLSPADWQVARKWYEAGIPLDLVRSTLDEIFAQRAERETDRPVQSLRYCAGAVESAWRSAQVLQEADQRDRPAPIATSERLARLAAAIPDSVPSAAQLRAEVRSLEGETEKVEAALSAIDDRVVESLLEALDSADRAALAEEASQSLETLSSRLAGPELDATLRRLMDQRLRRRVGLPVLSLFSEV